MYNPRHYLHTVFVSTTRYKNGKEQRQDYYHKIGVGKRVMAGSFPSLLISTQPQLSFYV
jgi:hypothetical protein